MSNFKRIILVGLFFIVTQLVVSQNSKSNQENFEEKFQELMEMVKKELQLDDLQAVFVKNALTKYRNERLELIQKSERNDILMAQVNDLNIKRDEELLKVLSNEQVDKLKDLLKNQPTRKKKAKGNRKKKKNK